MTETLTPHQEERLASLITVVRSGLADTRKYQDAEAICRTKRDVAWRVAQAVYELHEERLYKQRHSDFGEFCQIVLDMSRSRAYELINWVKMSANADTQIPTEAQARILRLVPEEDRNDFFAEATESGAKNAQDLKRLVDEQILKLPKDQQVDVLRRMEEKLQSQVRSDQREEKTLAELKEEFEAAMERGRRVAGKIQECSTLSDDGMAEVCLSLDNAMKPIRKARERKRRLAA